MTIFATSFYFCTFEKNITMIADTQIRQQIFRRIPSDKLNDLNNDLNILELNSRPLHKTLSFAGSWLV